MSVNEAYILTEKYENRRSQNKGSTAQESVFTYDEALDLAGNGIYSIMLLTILSIATLSMAVDIFGVSVVVAGATCDFNLGMKETGILLSVTFIGPILMAYPWGYLSDTQGRRKSLIISLWTSFLISAASSFSTNWITLAVFKLISTSFSSCAQATAYTLLGESCSRRFRDSYMVVMSSLMVISTSCYVAIAYFVLSMKFSYDLGIVVFTPWRLLALVLSMITGLGAVGIIFFYESPKFLLNQERHDKALSALAGIWRMNGGKTEFPVKKVVLDETGNTTFNISTTSILRSLWDQLVPIFKPPLLWRSLQLYYFTAVIYFTNNGYFMWLPYLSEKLVLNGNSSFSSQNSTVCSLIASGNGTSESPVNCPYKMDTSLLWFTLIQGVFFILVMAIFATIVHRKRFLMIMVFLVTGLSGVGAVHIENTIASFVLFLVVVANELVLGVISSYYVDLYPTSFRGMAACLGIVVARSSAMAGVSLFGYLLVSDCESSFYLTSVLMTGGVLAAIFLPKDQNKQKT